MRTLISKDSKKIIPVRFAIPFLILVFSLGAVFTGCAPEKTEPGAVKSKYGGALYFGVETGFHGFDVLGTGAGGLLIPSMATLNNLIQEPLFRTAGDGTLIPALGLSGAPSRDGASWDIKLREGVQFHDGTPFNADAVVHHWDRMLDPKNNYRGRKLFQPIRKVEKTGAYSVRFILERAWPPFLKVISDELYLSAFIPSPKAVKEGTHDRKPVGTGPFKYEKWSSGDHFVVVKNHRYWRKEEPYLNKVVFRSIPEHQTRYASLIAGQLDAITMDRGNLIQKAKKNDALYTHASEGNGAEIVLMNTREPPLDDIRVRRALALANNQELHVKLIYGGTIPVIRHPFGEWFTCMEDGHPEYDPDEARRLIAEYGKPVTLTCQHSSTSRGRSTGELLQQMFKKIGVTLELKPLETGPCVMNVIKGDYQLATWRILGSTDMGPQLYRSFHSNSPTNYSRLESPEMDALLEKQRTETDPGKRGRILCDIGGLLNQESVIFYRGGRRRHIITRKKIRDITDVSGVSVNLATAWIDENIRFNLLAFEIEKQSALPFDCSDPGDVDAIKAFVRGAWIGKDDWGATLKMVFNDDGTVTGSRTGGGEKTTKYIICGPKIFMRGRADVTMTVVGDKLEGAWEISQYRGTFTMERKKGA
ncbi:MAG: hypothetical protein GY859_25385 [Desulfobacterales bacterium]|nr:hypothetical protein [Desulfobacterales bacterium]